MATKEGVVAEVVAVMRVAAEKGVTAGKGVATKVGVAIEEGMLTEEDSEGAWPLRHASCSMGARMENKTYLLGPDKVMGSQTCVYFFVR
jgi:hypothetical protein